MLDEKKGDLELLFMKISKLESTAKFKASETRNALLDIESSFKYFFKSVKKDEFYISLPPKIKEKLLLEVFKPYTRKFSFFFEDHDIQYYADNWFICKIIKNLTC